jgi:hypothetical protein
LRVTERFRGDFTTQATLGAHQLEAFGDPDGPGDDRGDGQADHHDFHHDVGVLVHAPWGQVVGHAQRGVFDQRLHVLFDRGLGVNRRGCAYRRLAFSGRRSRSGGGGRGGGSGGWLIGHGHGASTRLNISAAMARQARDVVGEAEG